MTSCSKQHRSCFPHKNLDSLGPYPFEFRQAFFECLAVSASFHDVAHLAAIFIAELSGQCEQTRRGGFIVTNVSSLAEHRDQLTMGAVRELLWCVPLMLLDDDLVRLGGNRTLNSFTH
jgi:hypothetical protein